MKFLRFLLALVVLLILGCANETVQKDWAIVIVKSHAVQTNFFGTSVWTVAKIIESNRPDIKMIGTHSLLGNDGDTVKVFRIPGTGTWTFSGEYN